MRFQLQQHHTIIISLALPSAIVLLIALFVIWPSFREIQQTSAAITEEHTRLEQQYEQGKIRKKIREDLATLAPRLPLLETALLSRQQLFELIDLLETKAKEKNIQEQFTIDLESVPPPSSESSANIPFLISLDGSFPNILRFLNDLEMLPWYLTIETIRMERGIAPAPTGTKTPRAPMLAAPPSSVHVLIRGRASIDGEKND